MKTYAYCFLLSFLFLSEVKLSAITEIDLAQQEGDTIPLNVRPKVVVKVESSGWSRFAYVRAVLDTNTNVRIRYKEKGALDWIEQMVSVNEIKQINGEEGEYILESRILALEKNTSYDYLVTSDIGEGAGEFTTSDETPLVNAGFEDWTPGRIWQLGIEGQDFWGCGNVSILGVNADFASPLELRSEGRTKVVQLHSQFIGPRLFGRFGAGNIFTGTFKLKRLNGELNLGRHYTSRPMALKGYYKYKPVNVDHPSLHIAEGIKDSCHIYIALTTEMIEVKTKGDKFFCKLDPSIIAYAELTNESASETIGDGFHKFSLPLVYRDLYRQPMYIIIVCTSSKHGNHYAGGDGSMLWLDDLRLDFSEIK